MASAPFETTGFQAGPKELARFRAEAAALGLVTVLLIDVLQRRRHVRSDAAIGIVFTALFAVGVLLIARYGGNVSQAAKALGLSRSALYRRLQRFGL